MHNSGIDAQFDLRLLSLLVILYEERSVTAAAKKLGISQPALSKSLSKLRKLLGDDLFVKVGYGMLPTPRANQLIDPAREVIMRLKQEVLAETRFDPAKSGTTFTFATPELGEVSCFPKIVKALRAVAPQSAIRAVCPPERELLYGLESGEIEVAIGTFPELERHSYCKQRLVTLEAVCLMRADHPFKGNALSLAQYRSLEHVSVLGPRGSGTRLERILRRQRWSRRIAVTAAHFATLPMILQQSDLAATLWRPPALHFCRTYQNLKIMNLPFQAVFSMGQYWHIRYQNDQKNRWVRSLIKSLFKKEDDLLISSDAELP